MRLRPFPWCGPALLVLLLLPSPGGAASGKGNWLDPGGFLSLPWGRTAEQARALLPDLSFARYEVTGEKDPPWKMYERKGEALRIDGVPMDEVLYGFREDSFGRVKAVVRSAVGPRTLETPASEAFDRLSASADRFGGSGTRTASGEGTGKAKRTAAWRHAGLRVTLLLFDPPGENGEELTLEIVNESVELRRPRE